MNLIMIPQNNEEHFLEVAKKLNQKVSFLYTTLNEASNESSGLLIKEKDKKKQILLVNKAKSKKIQTFVEATEDAKANRFLIERVAPNIIYNFEKVPRKDSVHYKRSGLDQVLCKLLAKKNITVGFSFSSILSSKQPEKIIGRMLQNIRFCKKYKVKMVFSIFATDPYELRTEKDLKAFLLGLGVASGVVKEMF